jgi:hypothetical protein
VAQEKKAETPPSLQPGQPAKGGGGTGGTQKVDPTEAQIHAALANDPDLKLAQAKMQLAEAEMAKAKQAIVLKVLTLNASIKDQKNQSDALAQKMDMLVKSGAAVSQAELLDARMLLERATSALAKSELELKLLTGGMHKEMGANATNGYTWGITNASNSNNAALLHYWNPGQGQDFGMPLYRAYNFLNPVDYTMAPSTPMAKGPIPDRIRTALDKTVKLGAKGEQITFAKALEVFKKDAGLDVPVREVAKVESIKSEGEELPVGAWFQLFADSSPGTRFIVREYGLLVTLRDAAPPDALPLVEFWKRPVKKDPEPKAKTPTEPGR